jgi:hypothetical protein
VTLPQPFNEPSDIVLDSAFPSVLERPKLIAVAPNDFVSTVAEERWVEVNQVYTTFWELPENFLAISAVDCVRLEAHGFCIGQFCVKRFLEAG